MHIRVFENRRGYYYEGGVNVEFSLGDHDGVKGSNRFTSPVIFPSAGFGYTIAGRISNKKKAEKNWAGDPTALFGSARSGGAIFVGPYFTYGANNMSVVDGMSLHALTYGIKLVEIIE